MGEEEEIEEIRRKKLMEIMRMQQEENMQKKVEEEKEKEIIKQNILRQILEPEARERLARLRLVRPDVAEAVTNQLIMLAQAGRINRQITDDELKDILRRLTSQRREIRIVRR